MGLRDLWNRITGGNSDAPADAPASPFDGALSPEEAQALQDELAAQEEISFGYAPDCCYARAQRMSDVMNSRDIANRKTWTYGSTFRNLAPVDVNGAPVTLGGREVQWGYHVAPTVLVRGADGICRDMVIDPSLRDSPMTVEAWESIMGGASSSATSASDVFYRNASGGYQEMAPSSSEVDAIFAEHRASLAAAQGN